MLERIKSEKWKFMIKGFGGTIGTVDMRNRKMNEGNKSAIRNPQSAIQI